MKLGQQLQQRLSSNFDVGAGAFVEDVENLRYSVQQQSRDSLGYSIREFAVEVVDCANGQVSRGELLKSAQSLASRLTYLLEPIAVIEADEDLQTTQLRSSPPTSDEGTVSFYELRLGVGRAQLVRMERRGREAPAPALANVTNEQFVRLATDLGEAVRA